MIRTLTVNLTSACNLSCEYCFRVGSRTGRLTWKNLGPSLDWALARTDERLEVVFSGGEPLLASGLLRKAVTFLTRPGRPVPPIVRIQTNGLLLEPDLVDFLVTRGVFVNLSLDGGEFVQSRRGPQTWDILHRHLSQARANHPEWYASRLQVTMTLTPGTIPWFSDSVDHILDQGITTIQAGPAMTPVPDWDADLMGSMDEQFSRVFSSALKRFETTKRVPLKLFRKYGEAPRDPEARQKTCAALDSLSPVLDTDGKLYGCPMFAPSGLDPSRSDLQEISRHLDQGRPGAPSPDVGLEGSPGHDEALNIFDSGATRESRYGECALCPARSSCQICPLSLLTFEGGNASGRVPAFLCAWNKLTWQYRRDFPVQPHPAGPTLASILARMPDVFTANSHR